MEDNIEYSEYYIDSILDKINIVDVVGEYVRLTKIGSNYKGLCPFHNEKTPSFFVSYEKQFFYCFGCHEGGDVINFLRKIENLSFLEAIDILKDRLGIKDDKTKYANKIYNSKNNDIHKRKNDLYILNERVSDYYNRVLKVSENAIMYLNSRGITEEYINLFRLGYARNINDDICKHAIKNSIDLNILEKLSIIVKNDGKYRDFFRDRIMFPIFDVKGHVIAFGARTLEKNKIPKYLNSHETELFQKHNSFYGLNFALPSIKECNEVLVLEGYIDVISLFSNGIKNVVATLGTALGLDHINILKRYTNNVYLVFDGDEAGIKASFRSCDLFFNSSINLKIVIIPDGLDPDDFIKLKGKDAFLSLLKTAKDEITYKIEALILLKKYNIKLFQDKKNFLDDIFEIISEISDNQKLNYALQKISDITKDNIERIRFYFVNNKNRKKSFRGNIEKSIVSLKDTNIFMDIPNIEIDILRYIIFNPNILDEAEKEIDLKWISNLYIRKMLDYLFKNKEKYKKLETKKTMNSISLDYLVNLDIKESEYIEKLLSYIISKGVTSDDIHDFKKKLYDRFLKIRGKEYTGSLLDYVNDVLKKREL